MSSLTYSTPKDAFNVQITDGAHYSSAVKLPGGIIKISGQGGWDPQTGEMNTTDMEAHMDQAFANVDSVLRNAGSKGGWADVYYIRLWTVRMQEDGLLEAYVKTAKKWLGSHRPLLTGVGLAELWDPKMRVEIEVEALGSE